MRADRVLAVAILLFGAAAVWPAHAAPEPVTSLAVASPDAWCAAPPCGYIDPILDIHIPEKMPCGGARIIYADAPPTDCFILPDDGDTWVANGSVRWYWEVSEEGTYPKESGTDIVISFSGTSTNPRWLSMSIDGPGMVDGTFVIDDADLVDESRYKVVDDPDDPQLWYWYEEPVTITLSRDGSPSRDEVPMLDARQGALPVFIKAKSSESSARFRESFGVEEIRFMTCGDPGIARLSNACPDLAAADRDAPAPGWLVGVGGLAWVATLRRRR